MICSKLDQLSIFVFSWSCFHTFLVYQITKPFNTLSFFNFSINFSIFPPFKEPNQNDPFPLIISVFYFPQNHFLIYSIFTWLNYVKYRIFFMENSPRFIFLSLYEASKVSDRFFSVEEVESCSKLGVSFLKNDFHEKYWTWDGSRPRFHFPSLSFSFTFLSLSHCSPEWPSNESNNSLYIFSPAQLFTKDPTKKTDKREKFESNFNWA